MTVLIMAQKTAANSAKINVAENRVGTLPRYDTGATFRIIGAGLGAGEYVKLQYHDGTAWRDANINGNDAKILDEDNSVCTVYGRMIDMRVSKSVTAANIGVEVV